MSSLVDRPAISSWEREGRRNRCSARRSPWLRKIRLKKRGKNPSPPSAILGAREEIGTDLPVNLMGLVFDNVQRPQSKGKGG